MDPLSIASGVAGLITLAAASISAIKKYISSARNHADKAATLLVELEALQRNLQSLDELLGDTSRTSANLAFHNTSVLWTCTRSCEKNLLFLVKRLESISKSRMSRWKFPLEEDERDRMVQELRVFTQWIHLALTMDGCALLAKTSDEVMSMLRSQMKSFELGHEAISTRLNVIAATTAVQAHVMQANTAENEKRQILDWISTANPSLKHRRVVSSRANGTGSWLLESPTYGQWRDGSSCRVTQCQGSEGSGKTYLASHVIDDIHSRAADHHGLPLFPVAYFYFDYQDQASQTPEEVTKSLLRQLLEPASEIPHFVRESFERHNSRHSAPLTAAEAADLCVQYVSAIPRAYIVLDALDECDSAQTLPIVVRLIESLAVEPGARILVTHRPHTAGLTSIASTASTISVCASNHDIAQYVEMMINQSEVRDIVDDQLRDLITERLVASSQGMFLATALQIQAVLREPTIGDIEDALDHLSGSLGDIYHRTISRIHKLSAKRRELAMKTLRWVRDAKRPLVVPELQEALAMRPGQTVLNKRYAPQLKVVVESCMGLVSRDVATNEIRFAHYTVQQYLEAHSDSLFPSDDTDLGVVCLNYLQLDDFKDAPYANDVVINSVVENHDFLLYAVRNWGHHIRPFQAKPEIWPAIERFLMNKAAMSVANQMLHFSLDRWDWYWEPEETVSNTPLHIASRAGLDSVVESLLHDPLQRERLINARTKIHTTAIVCAASSGHLKTVRILLQYGADPYLQNIYGDALRCAAEANKPDVAKELIAAGMNPNAQQGRSHTIFCNAMSNYSAESRIIDALIECGADPNICCDEGCGTLLHNAVTWRHSGLVDAILKNDWVDTTILDGEGLTAHEVAMGRGSVAGSYPEIVALLSDTMAGVHLGE